MSIDFNDRLAVTSDMWFRVWENSTGQAFLHVSAEPGSDTSKCEYLEVSDLDNLIQAATIVRDELDRRARGGMAWEVDEQL